MYVTLLRHSTAKRVDNDDFNRELTPKGIVKANQMASLLVGSGIDIVICSPALRTAQTASSIAEALKVEIQFDKRLYNATFAVMKEVLSEENDYTHRLIVGHNPGISQLASILDRSMLMSFEPCQGATFQYENGDWKLVKRWSY